MFAVRFIYVFVTILLVLHFGFADFRLRSHHSHMYEAYDCIIRKDGSTNCIFSHEIYRYGGSTLVM